MATTPEPPEPSATTGPDQTQFEDRITALLQTRAEALDVHPGLDAVMQSSQQPRPGRSEGSRRWLAVAAVLAVIGTVGVVRAVRTEETTAAGEPTADEVMAEDEGAPPDADQIQPGDSLLIWLEVGITPTQTAAIAAALQSMPEIAEIRYSGPEETWREFLEYFADQPEVIELVEQDQLPTSFEITSSDPMAVAAAIESLPGVDAVDFEDPTPDRDESPTSIGGLDEDLTEPGGDPEFLALVTGATTIVFGGPGVPIESWDRHLLVWQDGATTRIGPFSNPRVDNRFVIDRVSDSGPTRIYDLAGRPVCELLLPDLANVHHVTTSADQTVVLGIEQGIDDGTEYRTEAFAHNCETGDRTAIEPFSRQSVDGEWVQIERIGDRVFEIHGDAEGNADPILNEDGVDIIGDDWAGQLIWSADGSVLAYGNHRNSPSPHATTQLAVRDTRTGRLLWETELPEVISRLDVIDDQLVVGQGEDQAGWVPTERIIVYQLRLGDEAGQALVIEDAPPGLFHLE